MAWKEQDGQIFVGGLSWYTTEFMLPSAASARSSTPGYHTLSPLALFGKIARYHFFLLLRL
jgi:hypothetical protein